MQVINALIQISLAKIILLGDKPLKLVLLLCLMKPFHWHLPIKIAIDINAFVIIVFRNECCIHT